MKNIQETIITAVADSFYISPEDITKKERGTAYEACARHSAAFLLCKITPYSMADIGGILGGRTAAAMAYSRDKIQDWIQTDGFVKSRVEIAEAKINKSLKA